MLQQKKFNTVRRVNGNQDARLRTLLFSLQRPFRWLSQNLKYAAILSVFVIVVLGGLTYFFYYLYIPGNNELESCSSLFVKLRERPSYGVMVDMSDKTVESIHIIGRQDSGSLASINLGKDNWVRVYFSENFPNSQVSELLRLSEIETGKVNYCWMAEQLSLLTGVPLEFMVFKNGSIPTVSTLRFSDYLQLYGQFSQGAQKELNTSLVDPQLLPDERKVPVITFSSFQNQYPSLFKISEVRNEQAFVEVYNSSPVSGYASLVAHKLTMLGIEVSRIGNASYETTGNEGAIVYVKNVNQYQKTLQLVLSSLPIGSEVKTISERPAGIVTTGDIVVILLKR